MKKRYKIRKEQLERVVESFVVETTSKKENLDENLDENLINENVLSDFIDAVKNAANKIKPKIVDMAKKDPKIMDDLKSAAGSVGEGESDDQVFENFLEENKDILTEGWLKNTLGKLLKTLGLGGIAVSVPVFISQLTGWSDLQWTTDLHTYLQPFCDSLPPKMCGPLSVLAIGLAIFMVIRGSIMKRNA